jgi:hypothetical protein
MEEVQMHHVTPDRDLGALARRQHGLVTRPQALRLGFTRHAIAHRIDRGLWHRVDRGVYAVAGAPMTWEQSMLVPVLASGGLAGVRAGARLWSVDGFRQPKPELIVPVGCGYRREGVIVHESVDFDLAEPCERHGIPVTSPVRTVIDLGTRVTIRQQSDAIDDVIRRGLAQWPDFYHEMVRLSAKGRNGVGTLRSILDERFGETIPDSKWNRDVQRLLVASGLPAPVAEYEVYDAHGNFLGRADLAYPDARVLIELQSRRHHMNEHGFEHDPLRRNKLQRRGYVVLEYTWRFYIDHPIALVAEVRASLEEAGYLS